MSATSATTEARKAHARSRVSNTRDILPNVDGRSTVARRFRDIASQVCTDFGGTDRCSEVTQQLVRRFSAAACLAEQLVAVLVGFDLVF